ncbi:sugar phosphate isomerase/epimerase family protein [Plantactinospora endophytica]|uniref:Isomerase n=1 Tax=Plantactinospora endophytica TaxID=673535 RepID=A0ABQ4E0A4_9ACTN|nr:sugar phosphate isomerase/epimerase family protein [Plantactinospora endophytica]GIG87767.1 isomerase [Plantactinospora endophytica]
MFPIGVNPWVWSSPVDDTALSGLLPRIAQWGFDAVELPVEQVGDWDPDRTRTLLDRYGLALAGVCAVTPPGRDLVRTDPGTVARTQTYLRHCVDLAAALGAPVVGGPLYAAVGRTWRMSPTERTACYTEFRTHLAPVAEYAGRHGVSLGIEALNRYETSVANTIRQLLELREGLPDNVGIMIDTYHMNIEEADPYAAIDDAGPHIKHVQVSGTDRGAPGRDHFDWPRFLAALRNTGYRGPICIESFTSENETVATAASIWRPLAETQDRLATDGLIYLRRLLGLDGNG